MNDTRPVSAAPTGERPHPAQRRGRQVPVFVAGSPPRSDRAVVGGLAGQGVVLLARTSEDRTESGTRRPARPKAAGSFTPLVLDIAESIQQKPRF